MLPAPPADPSPRRNAGFVRIFLAGITSQSGRTIAYVAIPWLVFTRTGSPRDVAVVRVAESAATIAVSLPAGVWRRRLRPDGDRLPRRPHLGRLEVGPGRGDGAPGAPS